MPCRHATIALASWDAAPGGAPEACSTAVPCAAAPCAAAGPPLVNEVLREDVSSASVGTLMSDIGAMEWGKRPAAAGRANRLSMRPQSPEWSMRQ